MCHTKPAQGRTPVSLLLLLALLMSTGCAFWPDRKSADAQTDAAASGYDIVLGLDRSSSIYDEECRQRNAAAKTLVQCATADCRLEAFFFAKNAKVDGSRDKTDTSGMLSLSEENNRQTFLTLFERMDRASGKNDGTNLAIAMQTALGMFDTESEKEKAIILFTDGDNYISNGKGKNDVLAAAKTDDATKKQVEKALTADNGRAIPIYIVYLGSDGSKKESQISKLCDMFSNSQKPAQRITLSEDDEEWNSFEWSESSNKVICVDDSDDLAAVFAKIFYKIKNVASKTYNITPNDDGTASAGFTVPNLGINCIQVTFKSKKDFKVNQLHSIDGSESIYINETVSGGETFTVTNTADGTAFSPGSWQVELEGSDEITGTVAVFADILPEAKVYQNEEEMKDTIECCTETSVSVELRDSKGKAISLPSGVTAKLRVEGLSEDAAQPEMTVSNNHIESGRFAIKEPGTYSYILIVDYDNFSYPVEGRLVVEDAAPKIVRTKQHIVYSTDRLMGNYIDIGPMSDYITDAHDGDELQAAVSCNGEPGFAMTYSEFSDKVYPLSPLAEAEYADDTQRHIFVAKGSNNKTTLELFSIDSAGNQVSENITLKLTSKEDKTRMHIFVGILAVTAAVIILYGSAVRSRNNKIAAIDSRPRAYSVFIKATDNGLAYGALIPCKSTVSAANGAYCPLDGLVLEASRGLKDKFKLENFPLMLELAENQVRLSMDEGKPLLTRLQYGLTFAVSQSAGGDSRAQSRESCRLDPDKKYTVTYNGITVELLFCRENDLTNLLMYYN